MGTARSARRVRTGLAIAATALVAACGSPDVLVVSERADRVPVVDGNVVAEPEPSSSAVPDASDPPPDPTTDPAGGTVEPIEPIEPMDPIDDGDEPTVDAGAVDPDAIDFGTNKPTRTYDNFLLAALTDIDAWLKADFEPAFGMAYEPLGGKVWAGYPERTDPLPGCGEPVTSYSDLQQFVAFYCPVGDFIVYDDGPDGLLAQLAGEYGAATIGIVLAHEYGHAIQSRTGALELNLATVVAEQQSDCIAGAWAGRAARGSAPGISFDDDDIRAGLIAMITVQDPVGIDPTAPGGHGSGFDRVGAFQVGFQEGLARCAQLIDTPLPLTPVFSAGADPTTDDAPFGFAEDELFGFLVSDLNLLYDNDLQERFPNFERLTLQPVQSAAGVECANPFGLFELGVELCSESNTVYLNEPVARARYSDFGDFAPGYLLGVAWAEAALRSNASPLTGEERQLRNDCLVGVWVRSVIPVLDENGLPVLDDEGFLTLPQPRDPQRQARITADDLTEAIQTAIVIGDPTSTTDVLGSPFEKIDAFRRGTLGGFDACG